MSDTIKTIIEILLTMVVVLLNVFVVPAFKRFVNKYISEKEYEKIQSGVAMLVQAAEQKFTEQGSGQEKFTWVVNQLYYTFLPQNNLLHGESVESIEKTYGPAIESAVYAYANKPTD